MPPRSSLPDKERQARSRLRQLLNNAEGFVHGSLIEMARRCGNPKCRCANDDQHKHCSPYLGQTRKGKTSMIYLGRDLEVQVRQWIDNYQQAVDLLEELSLQARSRIDKLKQSTKSARKAAKAKAGHPSKPKKKIQKAKRAARKKTSPP
jgi:hypothetical protein